MFAALILPIIMLIAVPSQVKAQETTDFFLRLNQLENQMRELSGEVERVSHENRQLRDQLRRFQEDVEFRFEEQASSKKGVPTKQKRSSLDANTALKPAVSAQPSLPTSEGKQIALSSETPASQLPAEKEKVSSGHPTLASSLPQAAANQSFTLKSINNFIEEDPESASLPSVAATAPGNPREGYELATSLMRQQQYEQAEMAFRQFLQSHPRDRLAANAIFGLGEAYFLRGRYREAAEQYLKLSTAYANNPLVPEGMLKLGMSLNELGARNQACATYLKTAKRYPQASAEVKEALDRALARAHCA